MRSWMTVVVFGAALAGFSQLDVRVRQWEGRCLWRGYASFARLFGCKMSVPGDEKPPPAPTQKNTSPGGSCLAKTGSSATPASSRDETEKQTGDEDDSTGDWHGPGYYCVDGIAPGPLCIYALDRKTLEAAGGTVLGGPFQTEAEEEKCGREAVKKRAAVEP